MRKLVAIQAFGDFCVLATKVRVMCSISQGGRVGPQRFSGRGETPDSSMRNTDVANY